MVKKFMEKRSKPKALFVPADFIAQDLKKTQKASNFSSLHRKLFTSGSDKDKKKKASPLPLTEVKSNTRTLAMVLRSERELLNQSKEYETQIAELKLMLEDKTSQVDKLKDLCLKQREEIQQLKNAILFPAPDVLVTSHPQQPKHVIPTLQRQVTSLTDQLQCLADDLAQVKADKFATRAFFEGQVSSPLTSVLDQEATNSLEFSSDDQTTPGSPDDIFFQDFNPCLTPYSTKSKSKEFDEIRGYNSPQAAGLLGSKLKGWGENHPHGRKLSKSSEYCKKPSLGSTAARTFPLSNKNKSDSSKPTWHKLS